MRYINIKISSFLIALVLITSSFSSPSVPDTLNWISFEEAVALQAKEPRKILIDVYTDWCGWCKKMDKYTYTDESVINNLAKNYYLVRFNAEQKEDITFRDKVFKFKTEYKSHELAVSLLNGQMSYPSTVFLDEDMNMLTVVPGYLTPKDINPILVYFGENIYKTKNWKEYESEL
jgi:thioredoxin-related protein